MTGWVRLARFLGWALAGLAAVAVLLALGGRFLLLPWLNQHPEAVAAAASQALGEKVAINGITAHWDGPRPQIELSGVQLFTQSGQPGLELPAVTITLAWRSLLQGRPALAALELTAPDLRLRRDDQGRLFIASLELKPSAPGSPGLGSALLAAGEIIVRDGAVTWEDEARHAPPLRFDQVAFRLHNRGRRHDFELSAQPPPAWASTWRIQGELTDQGDGRFEAAGERLELAAWQAWIDYPFAVNRGVGTLQLTGSLRHGKPIAATADLRLTDVSVRLADDLPELRLKLVAGQLGGNEAGDASGSGYEIFGRGLTVETAAGEALPTTDFTVIWTPEAGGAQGNAAATVLELAPLVLISKALPLPPAARGLLADTAPQGRLEHARFAWTGPLHQPATFSLSAGFTGLGLKPQGNWPGFANLSGRFAVTEQGGDARLDNSPATVDYPRMFRESPLNFATLAARIDWTVADGQVEARFDDVQFANPDLAARVSGSYRAPSNADPYLNLTAAISRADGRRLYRYLPFIGDQTARWLQTALVSASITEGSVRLQGNPKNFPFANPKAGVFEAAATISGGALDYAPPWPRLNDIRSKLTLTGRELRIDVKAAAMAGIRITSAQARIPDLFDDQAGLRLEAQARGPLPEVLTLVAGSPIREITGGIFDGWRGAGSVGLTLNLELPLHGGGRPRVTGGIEFADNQLLELFGVREPLTRLKGRVDFDGAAVTANRLTAQIFGGPITVSITPRPGGGLALQAEGTLDVPALARYLQLPPSLAVSGRTAYRARGAVGSGSPSFLIESDLKGIGIGLPPPFDKPPAAAWPSRLEWTQEGQDAGRRDRYEVTLGRVLNAKAMTRYPAGKAVLDRAGVGIGETVAALPANPGLAVAVNLPTLDIDRLLAAGPTPDLGAGGGPELRSADLVTDELIALNRRFNNVNVRLRRTEGQLWQGQLNSREVLGEMAYRAAGKGALTAKLKRLELPALANPAASPELPAREVQALPALALDTERFIYQGRDLGRLHIDSVNEGDQWRLRKLALTAELCRLQADGRYRWRSPPETVLDFTITADDIGRCLHQLGYPETVKNGAGRLAGQANWNGPIYAVDYPSLDGNLTVEAREGQFVQVKPGVGNLLALLSLQSLPRLIRLDFRDVFSEGFVFTRVAANARIAAGVINSRDFTMDGPAASVAMLGKVNLVRQTQDLTVRVAPSLSDAVAGGIAAVNPLVGAGTWLAQRLLGDPLGQILAFEYHITGSWREPQVQKVRSLLPTGRPAP